MTTIEEVVGRHRDELMKIDGVEAVAVGKTEEREGDLCVLVYVRAGAATDLIPDQLAGHPVRVKTTDGGFTAFNQGGNP